MALNILYLWTFNLYLINFIGNIKRRKPLEFIYKNKTYEVVKTNDTWRVYSFDIKSTVEELEEVKKELERLENNSKQEN